MKTIPPCEGERFNPLNDFLFLRTMGEKGDEEQLLGFLNAVLDRSGDSRLSSVEILENRSLIGELAEEKSCILDIRAVLQDGTRVNVEVQLRNEHNMDKRTLFYWSREFINSLKSGQDYIELPRVITINIVDFGLFSGGNFHNCFHLREDSDMTLLTDELEIHYIEMVKWRKLSNKDIVNNPLHRWLTWFDTGSPAEMVEEVLKMDNAILKAKERQDHILSDEDALRIYEVRQKAQWDYISEMNANRREGIEQAKIEIAQKMKSRGLPIEEIAECTGLSHEVVEKL